MTPIIFHEECWDVEIHLLVPAVTDYLRKYINILVGGDYDPGEYRGLCYYEAGKAIIAIEMPWEGSVKEICTLSHECCHAANHILSSREVLHNDATEECFAYLQESLLRRCLTALEERATIEQPAPPPLLGPTGPVGQSAPVGVPGPVDGLPF